MIPCTTSSFTNSSEPKEGLQNNNNFVSEINNQTLSSDLKKNLELQSIIDSEGLLTTLFKDKDLPVLEDNQQILINQLLELPIKITIDTFQGTVSLSMLMNSIREYYASRSWPEPKVEIIGGYVRWLVLQSSEFCHKILQKLGCTSTEILNQLGLSKLANYPPDYDIRIYTPSSATEADMNALIDIVVGCLAQTNSSDNLMATKSLIYQRGLKKKFVSFDNGNKYGVVSFGSCPKGSSAEMLFIKQLKREFTFTHTALKLIKKEEQWQLTSSGDFCWQSLIDLLTHQLHAPFPQTMDHQGWALYVSYLTKGYTSVDPMLVSKLALKVLQNKIQDTIIRCLSNHHKNRVSDFVALCMNAYHLDSSTAQAVWGKRSQLTLEKSQIPNSHSLEIVLEYVSELGLSLQFITTLFQVIALLDDSSSVIEHNKTLYTQISFKDNVYLLLPYEPKKALDDLKTLFPKSIEFAQSKKLQSFIDILFLWHSKTTHHPIDPSILTSGFDFLESKELLIRRIGYQLLFHYYKYHPDEKVLRQLLIRFPEIFINLPLQQHAPFFGCFQNVLKKGEYKFSEQLFSCEDKLFLKPQNPQNVLTSWLMALINSYDSFFNECAWSIWLYCITKMTPEMKVNLGTNLINSLVSINLQFCTNIFDSISEIITDTKIKLSLVDSILSKCSECTDFSTLLTLKNILKKIPKDTNKDLSAQRLVEVFLAKEYLEPAQSLLCDISDKSIKDSETVACYVIEFNKAMKAEQWEVAAYKALYLLSHSKYFENETGVSLSLILNKLHLKPHLIVELLDKSIEVTFKEGLNIPKDLPLAWLKSFNSLSIYQKESQIHQVEYLRKNLVNHLTDVLKFLESEGLVDEAYLFVRGMEQNKITFSLTKTQVPFCLWLFNNLLARPSIMQEVLDWLDTLLSKFVDSGVATSDIEPLISKVVDHQVFFDNYQEVFKWVQKCTVTSKLAISSENILKWIKIIALQVDFSSIASILLNHKEFYNDRCLGLINEILNEITTSSAATSHLQDQEALLINFLRTYNVSNPSIWKNVYNLVSLSNNQSAKKLLWSTLVDYADETILIDANEERAVCWLATLKCGVNIDKKSLLLLPSKHSLETIFDSSTSEVIKTEGYKWLFYHLLQGIKKDDLTEKAVQIFAAFKDKQNAQIVDNLMGELLSFEKLYLDEFVCKCFVKTIPNETITYVHLFRILSILQTFLKKQYELEDSSPFFDFLKEYLSIFKSYPEAYGIMEILLKKPTRKFADLLQHYAVATLDDAENDIVCEDHVSTVESVISYLTQHAESTQGIENILSGTYITAFLSKSVLAEKWNRLLLRYLNEGINNEDNDVKVNKCQKCVEMYPHVKSIPINTEFFDVLSRLVVQIEFYSCVNYNLLGKHVTWFCSEICSNVSSVPLYKTDQVLSYAILDWPTQDEDMSELRKCYKFYTFFLKGILQLDISDDILRYNFRQFFRINILKLMENSFGIHENLDLLEYFSLHGDKLFKDMQVQEDLVIKAFNLVYTKENYLLNKNKFFTIANTFCNKLPVSSSDDEFEFEGKEKEKKAVFEKGFLPIPDEKKIILDIVNNFLTKDHLLYQIKGIKIFYWYFVKYGTSQDSATVKMVFDQINVCLKNVHPLCVDSLANAALNFLASLQKSLRDDWWQEFVISLYHNYMTIALGKYPVFTTYKEAESFLITINNIFDFSYYKTNFIKNFPHAVYDLIEVVLLKLNQIPCSNDENFRDFLIVMMRLLVDLHCTEITGVYKEEVRQFCLISRPKSYPIMKKIPPVDRLQHHGRGARALWFKCFSTCGELLIRLFSKTEKTMLNEVFQGYVVTASKINDPEFKKESQRLLNLFFKSTDKFKYL